MSKTTSQYKSKLPNTVAPKKGGGKYQQGGNKNSDDRTKIK